MSITVATSLRDLAFIVGDALDRAGIEAVLSGGGAATVYAPDAYQSVDLDFIIGYYTQLSGVPATPLTDLGFELRGHAYAHPLVPFLIEFPPGPVMVGGEDADWHTLVENGRKLNILTPTDCVRDRLAWFLFNDDYAGLDQALMVARRHPIDLQVVEAWCSREGVSEKYRRFQKRLDNPK